MNDQGAIFLTRYELKRGKHLRGSVIMAARRWSEQDRDKVIRMVSQGKSRTQIAKALKTSISSLRRYFGDLLNHEVGAKPKEFTDTERASAMAMSSYGVPQREIADVLGVSMSCLRKHLQTEMKTAPTKANAAVARALYRKAVIDGDVAAQKYWLKNRASGWEDRVSIDGTVGGTVRHEHTVDIVAAVKILSPPARDALRVVLTELAAAREAGAIDVTAPALPGIAERAA